MQSIAVTVTVSRMKNYIDTSLLSTYRDYNFLNKNSIINTVEQSK